MATPLHIETEDTLRLISHDDGDEDVVSGANRNEKSFDASNDTLRTSNATTDRSMTDTHLYNGPYFNDEETPKHSNEKGSNRTPPNHRRAQSCEEVWDQKWMRQNEKKSDDSTNFIPSDQRFDLRPENFTFDDIEQEQTTGDGIEPCEALLDETFLDTIELVARWNDNEQEEVHRGAVAASHSSFPAQSYDVSQYREVTATPRTRNYDGKEYHEPYAHLISPSSVMSSLPYQNPYHHILSLVDAFEDFTFLLPILRTSLSGKRSHMYGPSQRDVLVARRRLACAVCFFGGNLRSRVFSRNAISPKKTSNTRKIVSLSRSRSKKSDIRFQPNIEKTVAVAGHKASNNNDVKCTSVVAPNGNTEVGNKKVEALKEAETENDSDTMERRDFESGAMSESMNEEEMKEGRPNVERKKTTYRCRLCGLPKQKHACIFLELLQRSIGTMVRV